MIFESEVKRAFPAAVGVLARILMKKICILAVICLAFTLAGCGAQQQSDPPASASVAAQKTNAGEKGAQAVDLKLTPFGSEKEVSLKELYADKPVYLNFWATWCPPCVHELPYIEKMYKKYGTKVNFVLVPLNDKQDDVAAFIKKEHLNLPVYYADVDKIDRSYDLQAIPVSIIIGKDGKILARHVGGMSEGDLEKFLEPIAK